MSSTNNRIDLDLFKVVTRSIAESDNLDIMVNHLAQLIVGALDIKACNIFGLNRESKELEILASFGLSISYLNKGPLFADKSMARILAGETVVIPDTSNTDQLQYPEAALEEGVASMVSIPIVLYGQTIGAIRLYHGEVWDVSERDLDLLNLLSETIGLALVYTQAVNALKMIRDVLGDLPVGLDPLFDR
jgi:transcriptional regulator with GAF, ATPase, and Fis domain